MNSRGLAITLIVAIILIRLWLGGPLGKSWNALMGPAQPLGGSRA